MKRIISHLLKRKTRLRLYRHYTNDYDIRTHTADQLLLLANGGSRSIDNITSLKTKHKTDDLQAIIAKEHHHLRSRNLVAKLTAIGRRVFGTTEHETLQRSKRKRYSSVYEVKYHD